MNRRIAKFEKVSFDEFKNADFTCIPIGVTMNENSMFMILTIEEIKSTYNDIKLPARGTKGSAGYDFYSPFDFTLSPGQTLVIPTGVRCKMEDGWFLGLFPRSGIGFKTGVSMVNTIPIIDGDYYNSDNEGHIMVKLENNSSLNKPLVVKAGQAFCQGILLPYGVVVDDNADAERNGGFGSTDEENK